MATEKKLTMVIITYLYYSKKDNMTHLFIINDNLGEMGAQISYDYSKDDCSETTVKALKGKIWPLMKHWRYYVSRKTIKRYLSPRTDKFLATLKEAKSTKSTSQYVSISVLLSDATYAENKISLTELKKHPVLMELVADLVPEEAEFPSWLER